MPSTYQLISSNVLTTTTNSVTFSAIPSTYTDLVVKASVRANRPTASSNFDFRINGDTSSLYSYTYIYGSGTPSVGSSRDSNATGTVIGTINADTSTANTFSSVEIYIPSYTASQNKPFGSFSVFENNLATSNEIDAHAHLYRSSTAITSINFRATAGSFDFLSGSSFYLYGIKNS